MHSEFLLLKSRRHFILCPLRSSMRKSICDFLMIFRLSSLAFKEREINKRILNDKIFDNVSIKWHRYNKMATQVIVLLIEGTFKFRCSMRVLFYLVGFFPKISFKGEKQNA